MIFAYIWLMFLFGKLYSMLIHRSSLESVMATEKFKKSQPSLWRFLEGLGFFGQGTPTCETSQEEKKVRCNESAIALGVGFKLCHWVLGLGNFFRNVERLLNSLIANLNDLSWPFSSPGPIILLRRCFRAGFFFFAILTPESGSCRNNNSKK